MDSSIGSSSYVNAIKIPQDKQKEVIIDVPYKELPPDSCELSTKKSKYNAANVALAGVASLLTGKVAFETVKSKSESVIKWFEKNVAEFMKDAGKNKVFNGFSSKSKAIVKFASAALASIAAFTMTFKDSDKDGQLDITESIQKFLLP